ncbi:MAG: hypothetical protein U0836_16500 [Pirellulales bacterium]
MRSLYLLLFLAIATSALAERPAKTSGQMFFKRGDFQAMLRNPAVQADLGLSSAVLQQIQERRIRRSEQHEAKLQAAQGDKPTLSKADEAEIDAWADRDLVALEKFARSLLNEKQLLRAQQIDRQHSGPLSIIDDDPLMKALELTDDQFIEMDLTRKHYFEAAVQNFRANLSHRDGGEIQQILNGAFADIDKIQQILNLGTDAERSVRELLTPEQRAKYEQLLGPPFKSDEGR